MEEGKKHNLQFFAEEDSHKEPFLNDTLENNFKYHSPKEGQPEKYELIREKAKELAYLIGHNCPISREKSIAMDSLETAVMWANASIARNE